MKRIVTIQDISCVGKCSLTTALPIISAMGVECSVLPTAVLSTHTAFPEFHFHDLTGEIPPITAQWKKQGITFDAVYTGYLGSFEQIHMVREFADEFRTPEMLLIVDPAMADFGTLYPGFDTAFAQEMKKLCAEADIILPNLTEASYLLDIPYRACGYTEKDIREILKRLAALGAKLPILTGVALGEHTVGAMAYDSRNDTFYHYENQCMPHTYYGTGDIFASTVVGGIMHGMTTEQALHLAVDYTLACIRNTREDPHSRWYGVNFEAEIPMLVDRMREYQQKKSRF